MSKVHIIKQKSRRIFPPAFALLMLINISLIVVEHLEEFGLLVLA